MSKTIPTLTDEQRERLARIRRAFRAYIEDPKGGMDLVLAGALVGQAELDGITIATLHEQLQVFSDADVRAFEPHVSSGYLNGAELLADIEALRADGLI